MESISCVNTGQLYTYLPPPSEPVARNRYQGIGIRNLANLSFNRCYQVFEDLVILLVHVAPQTGP